MNIVLIAKQFLLAGARIWFVIKDKDCDSIRSILIQWKVFWLKTILIESKHLLLNHNSYFESMIRFWLRRERIVWQSKQFWFINNSYFQLPGWIEKKRKEVVFAATSQRSGNSRRREDSNLWPAVRRTPVFKTGAFNQTLPHLQRCLSLHLSSYSDKAFPGIRDKRPAHNLCISCVVLT